MAAAKCSNPLRGSSKRPRNMTVGRPLRHGDPAGSCDVPAAEVDRRRIRDTSTPFPMMVGSTPQHRRAVAAAAAETAMASSMRAMDDGVTLRAARITGVSTVAA